MPNCDTNVYSDKVDYSSLEKECDGQSDEDCRRCTGTKTEFTMLENNSILPEPRKGQGLQHVSEFLNELLGEIL